jgi:hypothetical protein
LGDVYPTQGVVGPQKIVPFRPPAGQGGLRTSRHLVVSHLLGRLKNSKRPSS